MAEATQQDSQEAAPVSSDRSEESSFSFGVNPDENDTSTQNVAGINGATPAGDTPASFDVNNVDWLRADPNTLPEEYRPLTQLAKNLQSGFQQSVGELREQQKQASEKEHKYLQLIETLATSNGKKDADDPYADIRETLDPSQQAAIDTVREVFKRETGQTLETIQSEQSALKEGLVTIAKHMQSQQASTINDEVKSLRQAYGDDIDKYTDGIKALRQIVNPKTGKSYSITEAYENLSGAMVNKTINARNTDQRVRNDAAGNTLFPPSAESTDGQAPISETEVDAALKHLGFE
jgi:hypothetical protein